MSTKVLFIDRDGTIIKEPEDEQIDSLEKLEFVPGAITNLRKITEQSDYTLVMVTNQDGLGTDSFPEDTFWPAHNKMLSTLEGEGIHFSEILIDRSFPEENAPTRKPQTGLLTKYLTSSYDLENSYVIGDRASDVELAKNLGSKSIFISDETQTNATLTTTSWNEIYQFLILTPRRVTHKRNTKETKIHVELNLDGNGTTEVDTGLGFFDHMLDQLGKHSGIDLKVNVQGDLHIDEHHTIEDTAITIGEALAKAVGDKRGINRYGFLLPMDDSLVQLAIDMGGRPWLVWDAEFRRDRVGDMPTEMFYHFFKSFSDAARCNLNIKVEGDNEHHKIEATFKALAKALKMAVKRDEAQLGNLPTTKGSL